jgi:hypothetical protein
LQLSIPVAVSESQGYKYFQTMHYLLNVFAFLLLLLLLLLLCFVFYAHEFVRYDDILSISYSLGPRYDPQVPCLHLQHLLGVGLLDAARLCLTQAVRAHDVEKLQPFVRVGMLLG